MDLKLGGEKMKIAYIRLNDTGRSEEEQQKSLKKYNADSSYIEETDDPYKSILFLASRGDTVCIDNFSILVNSTKRLLAIIDDLEERGIYLISDKENLNTKTETGQLIIKSIRDIYEFEKNNFLRRQQEGIIIAKEEGKYKGRKPIEISEDFIDGYRRYMNREITKVDFAKKLNISRPTLDRLINDYQEDIDEKQISIYDLEVNK